MKRKYLLVVAMIATMATNAFAQEKIVYVHDTVYVTKPAAETEVVCETPAKNGWVPNLGKAIFILA